TKSLFYYFKFFAIAPLSFNIKTATKNNNNIPSQLFTSCKYSVVYNIILKLAIDRLSLMRYETTKIDRLEQLHKLYSLLSELSRDLSDFYSYPMFLASINIFVALIFPAYTLAKPIVLGKSDLSKLMFTHVLFYWSLCAVTVVFLTTAVSAVVQESKKSGQILNNYLLRVEDEKFAAKVIQFSHYLSHTTIKFFVFDLFSLGQSLLLSIAQSIATYLVILFQ
ncbi:uncharacterized protein LOC106636212, partial [Copidosoma floridanum]|uniref:uncharacterized protein LOC106636212 n=1 Tax=Copidosoma floridanum TaxID=29053 RepID=UPI000C6FB51D